MRPLFKNQKSKRNIILVCVISAAFLTYGILSSTALVGRSPMQVRVSDVKPGTRISYDIKTALKTLYSGSAVVNSDGMAQLSAPADLSAPYGKIAYDLTIKDGSDDSAIDNAKALNLIMNLDKGNNKLSLSGKGFEGFDKFFLQKDGKEEVMHADWSGMLKKDMSIPGGQLKMAFQTSNLGRDAALGEVGKIEVLGGLTGGGGGAGLFGGIFGEPSRDGVGVARARYMQSIMGMTKVLTMVMVMQTQIIGEFFDAKIQLTTQRKIQELKARASKDYYPSEQMCRIGTFIRSVAHTEQKSEIDKAALNKTLMNYYLGVMGTSSETGVDNDETSRVKQFAEKYCDPRDNNNSLSLMCPDHADPTTLLPAQIERFNKDIDYTRTVDDKLTLDVDFADNDPTNPPSNMSPVLTNDEEDVIALAKNLYMPEVFIKPDENSIKEDLRIHYRSRSYAAKLAVAHNSFINIIGMKSEAPEGQKGRDASALPNLPTNMQIDTTHPNVRVPPISTPPTTGLDEDAGWAYMKALFREFGISAIDMNNDGNTNDPDDLSVEEQIDKMLGKRPSYYAQMEVLTKKIYQNPTFYTNLYDKPANVKRIGAAIDAISLMSLRDRYNSELRQEMLAATLVEQGLTPNMERVSSEIYNEIKTEQPKEH